MSTPAPSSPADRLAELLRQRELITRHLAWLDTEIAAAAQTPPSAPPPSSALAGTTSPQAAPVEIATPSVIETAAETAPPPEDERLAAANARANEILERYAATDRFNPESTRRGCLLFAIATLVLGLVGLFVIYVLRYR
ncbi:MAG: hypothetical protein MUE42_07355 [Opitutaceae bacterium]|nr:hypothetical protein [Opitutaceae bacterium]